MGTLWRDLRHASRMLRKSPRFTAIAVLTLGLGIGCNTVIFSVIESTFLRPLPYPDSGQIVHFGWQEKSLIPSLSVQEFEFCRDHATDFLALAGTKTPVERELNLGATTRWLTALPVTDGFFETLGVNLQLGQPFGREYTQANAPNAAVLTYSLWRNSFKSDPKIVGSEIILSNKGYTVAGVLPPGFRFTEPADVFISLQLDDSDEGKNTDVIGRLKEGISLSQAKAETRLLGSELLERTSLLQRQQGGQFYLESYRDYLARNYRTSLLMLFGAVGLLLLIACANVASLLLARATGRAREISIRLALGAGPVALFRQFLAEGLLLGVIGAIAGFVGAAAILHTVTSAIPWNLPSVDHVSLDSRVLFFTSVVAIAISVAFGLVSFFQTNKVDLNTALKEGRAIVGPVHKRASFLNVLVIGEIAISLMLAMGAGLLTESLYNLQQQKLGFNPVDLIVMHTHFEGLLASSAADAWNFERQALEHIRALPGVQSAAVVSTVPLHGKGNIPVQRSQHPEDSIGGTEYRSVSSDYFSTMGIPLLRGRSFRQSDFNESAHVVLINRTLAHSWWSEENPIGDRVVIGEYHGRQLAGITQPSLEVIGIVGDVKGDMLGAPDPPMIYVPASHGIMNASTDWVIRTSAPAGIAGALRKAVIESAPDQRVADLKPMTDIVNASLAQPDFEALLMGVFGGLALILTLVGIYGVLNFQVAQRTHEIGIRMALGANPKDVLRSVIGNALKLATIGIAVGACGAWASTRLMRSLLFEVMPSDPIVLSGTVIAISITVILAAYLPARRAMRVDPLVALRYE